MRIKNFQGARNPGFLSVKKRGQVSSTLVLLVAGLIGLFILLMVTGQLSKMYKVITGKSVCQIEFFISSFTKGGGVQTTEPDCEPHKITITNDNLTKAQPRAQKALADYGKNVDKYQEIESAKLYWQHYSVGSTTGSDLQKEWAMNEMVAKEMKYCWDITGRGKLDLFSDWWKLIECKDKNGKPCTEDYLKGLNWANFKEEWISWGIIWPPNWQPTKSPTFCVLCSRIKFDQSLQGKVPQTVNNFGLWLDNNPVSDVGLQSKIPYAAYLQNDAYKGIWVSKNSYQYATTEPYAVVYARVNVFGVEKYFSQVGSMLSKDVEIPQAVQVIKLMPYKDLQNECTYLVG